MSFCSSSADARTALEHPQLTQMDNGASIVELKPNETGFHVMELGWSEGASPGLLPTAIFTGRTRFNIYKDERGEAKRFAKWVESLSNGTVVCICITDTAIAAKRPPGEELYKALRQLGASATLGRLMYRCPFAMIGWKGASEGEALVALEKTKVLLRLEATFEKPSAKANVKMVNSMADTVNVTEVLLKES